MDLPSSIVPNSPFSPPLYPLSPSLLHCIPLSLSLFSAVPLSPLLPSCIYVTSHPSLLHTYHSILHEFPPPPYPQFSYHPPLPLPLCYLFGLQKVSWNSKNIVFFPSFTPRFWSSYSSPASNTGNAATGTATATDGYTIPVSVHTYICYF